MILLLTTCALTALMLVTGALVEWAFAAECEAAE